MHILQGIHDLHLVHGRLHSRPCPNREEIVNTIEQMQEVVRIEPEGDITDFLGCQHRAQKGEAEYVLSQPQLIDQIISGLRLDKSASQHRGHPHEVINNPGQECRSNRHLMDTFIIEASSVNWDTLRKGVAPKLAYAVHQCTRFSIRSKETTCVMRIEVDRPIPHFDQPQRHVSQTGP